MDDDVISRMGAVAALRLEYPVIPMFKELREEWAVKTEGYRKAQEVILRLPSADRPQGEWIDKGWKGDWQFETDGRGNCWHEYKCSECGYIKRGGKSNYCPKCGAYMQGGKDD